MSNHLAIAATTATLKKLLEKATDMGNGVRADVTVGRPTKEELPTRINLYLYQISPNASLRNLDLPTRRDDGTLVQRPQAAIDLYYLLTFYGKEKDLESQILLGSTTRVMHAQPLLTQDMIRHELERNSDPKEVDRIESLAQADLDNQVERIRFTPLSLNLEELSKLWSIFFQIPYTLSVAYMASVVLIEADVTPQTALPVRRPDIYVLPFRHPMIEKISSSDGDNVPISRDSKIIISGRQLKGDTTKVNIGGVEVKIDPTDSANTVTDTQIMLSLDSAPFAGEVLHAGIQGVSVLHPVMMGDPAVEHYGFESNTKPIALSPTIVDMGVSGKALTLQIEPYVRKTQKVTLLLNEFDAAGTPHAYSIKAPDNNGITLDGVTATASITFSLSGVEPGDYLLRVQVDGAESPLQVGYDPLVPSYDPSNPKYISPQVNIP